MNYTNQIRAFFLSLGILLGAVAWVKTTTGQNIFQSLPIVKWTAKKECACCMELNQLKLEQISSEYKEISRLRFEDGVHIPIYYEPIEQFMVEK